MKKIIIFGAGYYGSMAFKFFGSDAVFCFCDNDVNKQKNGYLGKTVIGIDKLREIKQDYFVVVASIFENMIRNQLNDYGIECESFIPSAIYAIKNICVNIKKLQVENVAVYGIGLIAKMMTETILKSDCKNYIKHIAYCELVDEKVAGMEVELVEKVINRVQMIIIAEPYFHHKVYADLRKIASKDVIVFDPMNMRMGDEYKDITVFNPYKQMNGWNLSEEEWIKANDNKITKEEINAFCSAIGEATIDFNHVEIETINRCNGVCEFCPVNANEPQRKYQKMSDTLYYSIINQLREINYSGEIALFSNNEPLLDERIVSFNEYARQQLPNAFLYLFTNGTLLTKELFKDLICILDYLVVDNYSNDLELLPNCKQIVDYVESDSPELVNKFHIIIRNPKEILTSRGGDSPNRTKLKLQEGISCSLPFRQLIIRPDGKVSLCCNDALGKCTMGDLKKEKIVDVWNGKAFVDIRRKLLLGREQVEHCQYCDSLVLQSCRERMKETL